MRCLANDVYKITFRLRFTWGTRIEKRPNWNRNGLNWIKECFSLSPSFLCLFLSVFQMGTAHVPIFNWICEWGRARAHIILARFNEHLTVWMMSVQIVKKTRMQNVNEIWVKWLTKMNWKIQSEFNGTKRIFTSDTQMMPKPFKTACLIIAT